MSGRVNFLYLEVWETLFKHTFQNGSFLSWSRSIFSALLIGLRATPTTRVGVDFHSYEVWHTYYKVMQRGIGSVFSYHGRWRYPQTPPCGLHNAIVDPKITFAHVWAHLSAFSYPLRFNTHLSAFTQKRVHTHTRKQVHALTYIYICTCTSAHIHIHLPHSFGPTYTDTLPRVLAHTRKCVHTHKYACTHTHIHTRMHAHERAYTSTHVPLGTHTYTDLSVLSYTCAQAHTYKHTNTRACNKRRFDMRSTW